MLDFIHEVMEVAKGLLKVITKVSYVSERGNECSGNATQAVDHVLSQRGLCRAENTYNVYKYPNGETEKNNYILENRAYEIEKSIRYKRHRCRQTTADLKSLETKILNHTNEYK